MVKSRKKTTIEELPEWVDEKQREELIDSEDQEMEAIRNSLPGGVRCISVYRMHKAGLGGRPKFIAEIPPEQFRESVIQEMYGGGNYFGRWTKKDGSTIRYPFDIEGPEKVLGAGHEYSQGSREEEAERVIGIPAQPQPQGISPMEMFQMMQEARKEAREEMRMMLEMMRPAQQTPDMTKQVFDIVEKLAPMMGGGEGGGSPWMMALAQFKEPIIKLVDSISQAATRSTQQPLTTSGKPAVQASVTPPQPQTEEDMLKILIRQYMPMFVNAARCNGSPDLYAEMILEQMPESMYPKLEAWLSTSEWFQDVKSIDPIVEAQAGWWNLLRAAILEGMVPDADSVQPSTASSKLQQNS